MIEHCILASGLNGKDKASSVGVEQLIKLNQSFADILIYMESVAPHPVFFLFSYSLSFSYFLFFLSFSCNFYH